MDAAHREALRAWREDPGDPEALAALVSACRRAGEPLPPEADPALLVPGLMERARAAHRLASGIEAYVAWARLESAAPSEDALGAAVERMGESQGVDPPQLMFPGNDASLSSRPTRLCFDHGLEDPSPEVEAAFASLEAHAADVVRRLPGACCKRVGVYFSHPWVRGHDAVLLQLPEHGESYLVVVQWVDS